MARGRGGEWNQDLLGWSEGGGAIITELDGGVEP